MKKNKAKGMLGRDKKIVLVVFVALGAFLVVSNVQIDHKMGGSRSVVLKENGELVHFGREPFENIFGDRHTSPTTMMQCFLLKASFQEEINLAKREEMEKSQLEVSGRGSWANGLSHSKAFDRNVDGGNKGDSKEVPPNGFSETFSPTAGLKESLWSLSLLFLLIPSNSKKKSAFPVLLLVFFILMFGLADSSKCDANPEVAPFNVFPLIRTKAFGSASHFYLIPKSKFSIFSFFKEFLHDKWL